jgi:hypothetical protein
MKLITRLTNPARRLARSPRKLSSQCLANRGLFRNRSFRDNRPPAAGTLPLLLLLAALVTAGCRDNLNPSSSADPVGTYQLISVDGNQVPCSVRHGDATLAVKAGFVVFQTNQTCSSTMKFTPPTGHDMTHTVVADYSREGSKLTMRWRGAGITAGTLAGGQFTMNNEGTVFVYQK